VPGAGLCRHATNAHEQVDILQVANQHNIESVDYHHAQCLSAHEQIQKLTEEVATLRAALSNAGPADDNRDRTEAVKQKERADYYKGLLNASQQTVDTLSNEALELTEQSDAWKEKMEQAVKELAELKDKNNNRVRGRSPSRAESHVREASLSPFAKAQLALRNNMGPPPRPNNSNADRSHLGERSTRRTHREPSTRRHRADSSTSRHRDMSATPDHLRNERQDTADSNVSHASGRVNPRSDKAVSVDRSIKEPEQFNGTTGFYQWLSQMELKLSSATFQTDADGLRYVRSFLKDSAWNAVNPRIPSVFGKPCPNPFRTVKDMLEWLVERYGEDNTEEKAMTAMANLKQGPRQDFNAFYAKYQEYQAYCPLDGKQEVHRLMTRLNSTFSNKLKDGTEYATEKELVSRCIRLQAQTETGSVSDDTNAGGRGGRNRGGRSDDSGSKPRGSTRLPRSELPNKYRNLPALTADLRAKLIDEKRCFKCRELGHSSRDRTKCPITILEDAHAKKHEALKPNHTDVAADGDPEKDSGNGGATR
jgi:hypothetical protein